MAQKPSGHNCHRFTSHLKWWIKTCTKQIYLDSLLHQPRLPSMCLNTKQIANLKPFKESLLPTVSTRCSLRSIYRCEAEVMRESLPTRPQTLQNSYDDGEVIINKRLYDPKLFPHLYWISKKKDFK